MNRKVIAIILTISVFGQMVSASTLGSFITSWSIDIANNVTYNHNKLLSEQSGVGQQSEHFAVYTPNEDIKPVIISGEALWGRETIEEAEEYMINNGLVPMIGINASYFSYETGLPMGHIISDGKILSKDSLSYQSIGFNYDGTAFIAPLEIKSTISFEKNITTQIIERIPIDAPVVDDETNTENIIIDEKTDDEEAEPQFEEIVKEVTEFKKFDVDIAHINKYNQPAMDIVNLYTTDFDAINHSEAPALSIILGVKSGELKLGEEINAIVEEKFNYDSSITIPENKLLITVNEIAKPELYNSLNYLAVGDEVKITNISNDSRWNNVESALGSVGETLIENSIINNNLPGGSAPRTAIGITKTGDVVFYVLDGRQEGISYGAKLDTIAERMQELGCVDAINLDGGGSTAISGIYPGCDQSQVLNSPSDGKLRPCTNYIFLHNTKGQSEIFNRVYFYPFEQHYLSGYSEKIDVKAIDTNYYKTIIPDNIEYWIENNLSTYIDGVLTAKGTGEFKLTGEIDGEKVGSARYFSYETPTEITVYNKSDNSEIIELNMKKGDQIPLTASAKHYYIPLKSNDSCYTFSVSEEIGYFEDNKLIITSDGGEGMVYVTAGEYTKEIPIKIEYEFPFIDISEHWANIMIKEIYEKNIISGYETEEGLIFNPDNNMTREEFAVIMGRFMELDIDNYNEYKLNFADNESISDWSRPYVCAMYDNKIINGKQAGDVINFAPKDTITRAEAITIIGRTLEGAPLTDLNFEDNDEIPEWATEFISKMSSLGFISGYEDNTIRPNNFVTRAEAVTLLYKML